MKQLVEYLINNHIHKHKTSFGYIPMYTMSTDADKCLSTDNMCIEFYDKGYIGAIYVKITDLINEDVTLNNLSNFIKWVYDNKKIYKLDGRTFKGTSSDLRTYTICAYNNNTKAFQKYFAYYFASNTYLKFETKNAKNYADFQNPEFTRFMEQQDEIPNELQ